MAGSINPTVGNAAKKSATLSGAASGMAGYNRRLVLDMPTVHLV
jgi:hypothetical protein